MFSSSPLPLDGIARIIQVALTPVFLLSGIAALLNVFSTRLGRVADQVEILSDKVEAADNEEGLRLSLRLGHLRRRSWYLDVAVLQATVGSVSIGFAILTLLVGALSNRTVGSVLFGFFGFAVACTIGSLAAFLAEAWMAGRGVRIQVEARQEQAARK